MDQENTNPAMIKQMLEIMRNLATGKWSQPIVMAETGADAFAEFMEYASQHLQYLQRLEAQLPLMEGELEKLVDGIQDVLQTIEKASIRVLDNTDGILEQHDTIEKTIQSLKQNPAIARVIGKRLDSISQVQNKSRMFVFDSIQAQEFQELTKKQTEKLVGVLQSLQQKLKTLHSPSPMEDNTATTNVTSLPPEPAQAEAPKDKIKQNMVDELLAEFGL